MEVWLGHVAVRYVESRAVSIRIPAILFATVGLLLVAGSLLVSPRYLSALFGITGVIALVDALELHHQEERVIKGRAPANPQNPRHIRILAEHSTASSIEWLKREPRGRLLSEDEIRAIREEVR